MQSVVGVAMVPEAILEKLEPMFTVQSKNWIIHCSTTVLLHKTISSYHQMNHISYLTHLITHNDTVVKFFSLVGCKSSTTSNSLEMKYYTSVKPQAERLVKSKEYLWL